MFLRPRYLAELCRKLYLIAVTTRAQGETNVLCFRVVLNTTVEYSITVPTIKIGTATVRQRKMTSISGSARICAE